MITVAGGSLQVPQLSDINGGSVLVSQGSTLSLPLVLSYEHTGTGRTVLQAKDQGSVLDLSKMVTIVGSNNVVTTVAIEALSGGKLDLSSVREIVDPESG